MWDNGFRQVTSSARPIKSPADFAGFKIRVALSPIWMSLFKAFRRLAGSFRCCCARLATKRHRLRKSSISSKNRSQAGSCFRKRWFWP